MSRRSPVRSIWTVTAWWFATAFIRGREVTTAAGAVRVKAPRVNDKRTDTVTDERKRFASAILPVWLGGPRRSRRCCRCCAYTACQPPISGLTLEQFSTARLACRRPRSPGSLGTGRTKPRRSTSALWPIRTTCPAGSTAPPQGPPHPGHGMFADDNRGPGLWDQGVDRPG